MSHTDLRRNVHLGIREEHALRLKAEVLVLLVVFDIHGGHLKNEA